MNKEDIGRSLLILLLLAGCLGILYGHELFMVGFHNVDQGQNTRYLNAEYNLSLVDIYNIEGYYLTDVQQYIIGIEQMDTGYKITTLGAVLFGMYLTVVVGIIFKRFKEK